MDHRREAAEAAVRRACRRPRRHPQDERGAGNRQTARARRSALHPVALVRGSTSGRSSLSPDRQDLRSIPENPRRGSIGRPRPQNGARPRGKSCEELSLGLAEDMSGGVRMKTILVPPNITRRCCRCWTPAAPGAEIRLLHRGLPLYVQHDLVAIDPTAGGGGEGERCRIRMARGALPLVHGAASSAQRSGEGEASLSWTWHKDAERSRLCRPLTPHLRHDRVGAAARMAEPVDDHAGIHLFKSACRR